MSLRLRVMIGKKMHIVKRKIIHLCLILIIILIYTNINSFHVTSSFNRFYNHSLDEFYSDEIPYGITLVGANKVWDITQGSSEIIVAVLDSGVSPYHPDLKENIWNNTDEIPGNSLDDDQNGYIDDTNGWDFPQNNNDPFSVLNPDNPILSDHGTHVAGIIAARLNNYGVVGVAPNVTIMPLRILNTSNYNPDIYVAEAILYAANNGANIISMSISIVNEEITNSTSYELVEEALEYAYMKGVLIVAAAGNSGGQVERPANNPYVIAVGAVDSEMNLASFSNRGTELEVVAPGVGVISTIPGDDLDQGDYKSASGTSFAAPHVSGVLALILSYNSSLTHTDARRIMQLTSDDLGDPNKDLLYGYGLVNVSRAIDSINDPDFNISATGDNTSNYNTTSTINDSKTTTFINPYLSLFYIISIPVILGIKRRRDS